MDVYEVHCTYKTHCTFVQYSADLYKLKLGD